MTHAQRLFGLYYKNRAHKVITVGGYKVFGKQEECRLHNLLELLDSGDISDLKTNVFMLLDKTPTCTYYVRFPFSYIEHGKRVYEIVPVTFDNRVLLVYLYIRDKYTKDNVEIRVSYYGKHEKNNYRVNRRNSSNDRVRFI